MQTLNYNNLLRNRCPKCNKILWFDKTEEMVMCTLRCGFMIHKDKMEKICVNKTIKTLDYKGLLDA
jgi:hypothetical protein